MNNFNNIQQPYYTAGQSQAAQTSLIQRVSYLLATTLLVTAAAAWYANSIGLGPQWFLPLAIGTVVIVFALRFARANPALASACCTP